MTDRKDPLELTPGLKMSLELGEKFSKPLREKEEYEKRIKDAKDSLHVNFRNQLTNETARKEKGLVLQEQSNVLQEKQNSLTEQSIALSKWAIGIAIVGACIALLSLALSVWTLFGRC